MKKSLYISCPASSRSGYGDHSRDLIHSLIAIDRFEIKVLDQRWGDCPMDALDGDSELDGKIIEVLVKDKSEVKERPDVWIQVTVPNEFQPVGHYNIGITAGMETTMVHEEWLMGCNRMDMVIVPSKHSKVTLQDTVFEKVDKNTKQKVGALKLEKPIEILFEGLDTRIFDKEKNIVKIEEIDSIKEQFCFLVCGHWLKGDFGHDRKDIGGTIRTFLETFKNTGNKRPALIIKTSGAGFSVLDREECIKKIQGVITGSEIKNPPNIYFLHGDLTSQQMNSLYNHPKVKAMVSLTKGEGFGRPLLEFSITGKPVIASNWSGHIDFLSKHGIMLAGELKDVHESAVWEKVILKESKWFYADYGYASMAMREVFKNYKSYHEKSRKQTKYVKDNFTLDKMTIEFEKILKVIPEKVELALPKLERVNG